MQIQNNSIGFQGRLVVKGSSSEINKLTSEMIKKAEESGKRATFEGPNYLHWDHNTPGSQILALFNTPDEQFKEIGRLMFPVEVGVTHNWSDTFKNDQMMHRGRVKLVKMLGSAKEAMNTPIKNANEVLKSLKDGKFNPNTLDFKA